MKLPIGFLTTVIFLTPFFARAGQTAEVRAQCISLKFSRGSEPFDLYSLDITTLDPSINGELGAFFFQSPYTHGCWINLNDEIFGDDPIPGAMVLDTPAFIDLNGDGFDDFFEVSQGIAGGNNASSGEFDFGVESGTVEATWSRSPGSSSGTCVLQFRTNPFQVAYEFTHTFELIEYTGTIDYQPGSNHVSGVVDLARTGSPGTTLGGQVECLKSTEDPTTGDLEIQPGLLTNAFGQEFQILGGALSRDPMWPTNYYGPLEFQDGEPNTSGDDYYYWAWSIDDTNDADSDGIPDFSDDPQIVQPTVPNLAIEVGMTNVLLTISGEVGRIHEILSAGTVDSDNWQTNFSMALTNSPYVVTLPLPTATTFWRARVW